MAGTMPDCGDSGADLTVVIRIGGSAAIVSAYGMALRQSEVDGFGDGGAGFMAACSPEN